MQLPRRAKTSETAQNWPSIGWLYALASCRDLFARFVATAGNRNGADRVRIRTTSIRDRKGVETSTAAARQEEMANGPKNNVAEQLAQLRRDKSAAGMAGLSQQPQGRQQVRRTSHTDVEQTSGADILYGRLQGAFQYAQPKVPPLASSTPSGLTAKRVVKQEPSGTRVASTSTPTVPVKRKAPSSSIQEMIGLTQEVSEKGGGSTRSKGKRKQEEVEEPDDSGFIEIPSIEKKASAAPPQSYRADTVSSTSTLQDDVS